MAAAKPLPDLWLLTDARNDAALEVPLARMPRGSALVYRHYHLAPEERIARYRSLARLARSRGHIVILADSALTAKEWGADGIYGAPRSLSPRRAGLISVATAHSLRELAQARAMGADAVMLSPAVATNSHPGASTLGPVRFRLLALRAGQPVIALGGMNRANAHRLQWPRWAAIDGLSG